MTSFSLTTYYTSDSIDLVANGLYTSSLVLVPGSINIASVVSTATTTYTFGDISVTFTNQNSIPVNGKIVLTIPGDLQLLSVSSASLTQSNSVVSTNPTYDLTSNTVTL